MTGSVEMILGVTRFSEGRDQQGQRFRMRRLDHVDPNIHLKLTNLLIYHYSYTNNLSVGIFYVVSGGQSLL